MGLSMAKAWLALTDSGVDVLLTVVVQGYIAAQVDEVSHIFNRGVVKGDRVFAFCTFSHNRSLLFLDLGSAIRWCPW